MQSLPCCLIAFGDSHPGFDCAVRRAPCAVRRATLPAVSIARVIPFEYCNRVRARRTICSMSRLARQMLDMQSWRDNYTLEQERRRDAAMLRDLVLMLVEAVAVTAFLASFH